MKMMKKIALVGRANVGKSTIFNRLTGSNAAIVDKKAGITRDRKEGLAEISDIKFTLIDTAGIEVDEKSPFAKVMNAQSAIAIYEADILFFVVSAKENSFHEDTEVAEFIRKIFKENKITKPVILVANKSENVIHEIQELRSLGFGEPAYVSAEHNVGFTELYTLIKEFFENDEENESVRMEEENMIKNNGINGNVIQDENDSNEKVIDTRTIRIAVVGRPNVGKSTLVNTLIGDNRLITSDIAGTTTDSVHIQFKFNDRNIEIVDTAGKRKNMKIINPEEKLFVEASEQAIRDSHVTILVIDANSPFEKQDLLIADAAIDEGKCVIVALNKWDLIPENEQAKFLGVIRDKIGDRLSKIFKIIPISALRNINVEKLINESISVYSIWNKKITTNKLNLWLNLSINANAPAIVNGKTPKLNFVKQVGTRPPSFAIFGSRVELISDSYIRYLSNSLAKKFKMENVPIRIFLRQKDNPYNNKISSNRLSKEDRMKRSARQKNAVFFSNRGDDGKSRKNIKSNANIKCTKSMESLGEIISNAKDLFGK